MNVVYFEWSSTATYWYNSERIAFWDAMHSFPSSRVRSRVWITEISIFSIRSTLYWARKPYKLVGNFIWKNIEAESHNMFVHRVVVSQVLMRWPWLHSSFRQTHPPFLRVGHSLCSGGIFIIFRYFRVSVFIIF